MGRNLMAQIAKYLSSYKRRKMGYWVLCSLGAVVVFCTTYALILPAITMSNEPICGLEAHVHDESCWSLEYIAPEAELVCEEWRDADVVFHTHDALCYDSEGVLICPLEERVRHVHSESCFIEQMELICEETASEPEEPVSVVEPEPYVPDVPYVEPHVHTEACYTLQQGELICGLEEDPGHQHTEECYTSEFAGAFIKICPYEEGEVIDVILGEEGEILEEIQHHHDDNTCYQPEMMHVLSCGQEERDGHQHTDECYTWEQVLICEEPEIPEYVPEETPVAPEVVPEIPEAHVHTEECYQITRIQVCGEEEYELHTHGPECYEIVQVDDGMGGVEAREVLVCQLPVVIEHQHTEACLKQAEGEAREVMVRTCGMEAHVHDDSCYLDLGPDPDPYRCGLAEHTHTAECYFESGELRCTVPEHIHTEECLDPDNFTAPEYPLFPDEEQTGYVCGLEAHEHTDECWLDGELICGLEEHVHGEECLPWEDGQPDEDGEWLVDENGNWILDENGERIPLNPEDPGEDGQPGEDEPGQDDPDSDGTDAANVIVLDNAVYPFEMEDFTVKFHVNGVARVVDGNADAEPDQGEEFLPLPPDAYPWDDSAASAPSIPADQPGEDTALPAAPDAYDPESQPGQEDQPGQAVSPDQTPEPPAETEDGEEIAPDGGLVLSMFVENESFFPDGQDGGLDQFPGEDTLPGQEGNDAAGSSWQTDFTVNGGAADNSQELQFTVERLEEGDEGYEEALNKLAEGKEDAEDITEEENTLLLGFLRIAVTTADGAQVDLSDCDVEIEITPTEQLTAALEEMASPMAIGDELADTAPDAVNGGETGVEEPNAIILTVESLDSETIATTTVSTAEAPENMLMTMKMTNQVETVMMYASMGANPKFEVQYYAWLTVADLRDAEGLKELGIADDSKLPMIDTSGGQLPSNAGTVTEKYMYIKNNAIATEEELTPIFSPYRFQYSVSPGRDYFDIVQQKASSGQLEKNYTLKEIWVLKEGHDRTSTKSEDWDSYPSTATVTNRPETADADKNCILIKEGTVIRLVYDTTDGSKDVTTNFYDYDVTDGKIYATEGDAKNRTNGQNTSTQSATGKYFVYTEQQGINSPGNYPSGSGAKFAFGNGPGTLLTGLGDQRKGNYFINQATNANGNIAAAYNGCSFGLVQGMDAHSEVIYADGIIGPNLFSGETPSGKTYISEINSLRFSRKGDTYTLTGVPGTDVTGLENFKSMWNWNKTRRMWYNNFWPMDAARTWGADGHDLKFGDSEEKTNRKCVDSKGSSLLSMPEGDDGNNHNAYFGMNFEVEFEFSNDYMGPLEYYFFGDDDMWVFLTKYDASGNAISSQLVCDIGGVHSSVGEYVNLWDYMGTKPSVNVVEDATNGYDPTGSTRCRLTFFYTERGASGSTCWMQFTLPSASATTVSQSTSSLRVEKKLDGASQTDEEFQFKIKLWKLDGDGKKVPVLDDYNYIRYDVNGDPYRAEDGSSSVVLNKDVVFNGATFALKAGEYMKIHYLPVGTYYSIVEEDVPAGYLPSYKKDGIVQETGAELTIGGNDTFTVTNHVSYSLPSTGGPSALTYTLGGMLLLTAAAGSLVYKKRSRRRGAADKT